MQQDTKVHVYTACHVDQHTCPKVFVNPQAMPEQRVSITDDFGNEVHMSNDQFDALISKGTTHPLPR